jgi:hypothetical protein
MEKISCMKSDGRLALSNEKTPAAHFINSLRLSMFLQFRLDQGGTVAPFFVRESFLQFSCCWETADASCSSKQDLKAQSGCRVDRDEDFTEPRFRVHHTDSHIN